MSELASFLTCLVDQEYICTIMLKQYVENVHALIMPEIVGHPYTVGINPTVDNIDIHHQ